MKARPRQSPQHPSLAGAAGARLEPGVGAALGQNAAALPGELPGRPGFQSFTGHSFLLVQNAATTSKNRLSPLTLAVPGGRKRGPNLPGAKKKEERKKQREARTAGVLGRCSLRASSPLATINTVTSSSAPSNRPPPTPQVALMAKTLLPGSLTDRRTILHKRKRAKQKKIKTKQTNKQTLTRANSFGWIFFFSFFLFLNVHHRQVQLSGLAGCRPPG